jgi:hypothetical protein
MIVPSPSTGLLCPANLGSPDMHHEVSGCVS